jgi:4'-phosphopantetheinyl transferase
MADMTSPACWQTPPAELRLESGEAHVWLGALDVPPERLLELRAVLRPDELARSDRFLQAHHRVHSAAARGFLRTLLGRYLGLAPQSVELQFNPFGKPSLAGVFAARSLRFNVSHSHGLALFAFARGRELGVDLEKIRPDFASTEIAGRFFSAAESARLRSLAPEERARAFFECWTRKEAYIKARGAGLSRRLDTFEVAFGPGTASAILAADDEPDAAVRWVVHDLQPADGYCGALVVEGPGVAVACWKLD